jgi:hypothetical protein
MPVSQRTPAQRSAAARLGASRRTPLERSRAAKLGWSTRRRRAKLFGSTRTAVLLSRHAHLLGRLNTEHNLTYAQRWLIRNQLRELKHVLTQRGAIAPGPYWKELS